MHAHQTGILPLVLYGCETWSLTLREEHRLRVSEIKVMRRLSGRKEEVAGGWRRLHNEELHNLYTSPNVIRMNKSMRTRSVGHVASTVQMKNECKILVGKPERKRHSEDLRIDGKIILEWVLGKCDVKLWIGGTLLTVGTSGGLLCTR
jgi:hypothetical protein